MNKNLQLRGLAGIAIIIFCSFHANAQENSVDPDLFKGNVKVVYESVYRAISENGVIGKGEVLAEQNDTILFNTDGIHTFKNKRQPPLTDSIAYQYDQTGRCVKMSVYYPNKQLRESRTLVYNDQGKLKLCILRSTDDEVVDAISYTYDPYGKLAIKIYNRKDGEMYQQRFAYDANGNWIVRVDFKEYEPLFYVERHIEYDTE